MDVMADTGGIVVTVARTINVQQMQKRKVRIGRKVIITKERKLC
jgi:NAD-dependent DNA ligase